LQLHLMERDGQGNPASAAIAAAEERADRLAYELLAPAEHVLATHRRPDRRDLTGTLQASYGLPALQAARYARILRPPTDVEPLLVRWKSGAKRGDSRT